MSERIERTSHLARRGFLGQAAGGLGVAALASLIGSDSQSAESAADGSASRPHFAPRARRVIYLFQSGAPSQMDL
ncbi:MAG: sulfatase, partial [Planctomycetales bacterium]|nr:sulfatase [Planctomycetales bacterium]